MAQSCYFVPYTLPPVNKSGYGPTIKSKDGVLPMAYDSSRDFDLSGRDLSGVCFSLPQGDSPYIPGTLLRVNFAKSKLICARFEDIDLKSCSFKEADMRGCYIHNDMYRDCLSDCDLEDAIIHGYENKMITAIHALSVKQLCQSKSYKERNLSNMIIGRWSETNYDYDVSVVHHSNRNNPSIDLSNCNLQNTTLPEVHHTSSFADTTIKGAKLTGLTKKQLYSTADYKNGTITDVVFTVSDYVGDINFANTNLTGCKFNSNIRNADFSNAIISNCDFDFPKTTFEPKSAQLNENQTITARQIKSTWNYKNNRMNGIKLPRQVLQELNLEQEK
jgi:uncharacterized protein YjbI with pentapeptide repeats